MCTATIRCPTEQPTSRVVNDRRPGLARPYHHILVRDDSGGEEHSASGPQLRHQGEFVQDELPTSPVVEATPGDEGAQPVRKVLGDSARPASRLRAEVYCRGRKGAVFFPVDPSQGSVERNDPALGVGVKAIQFGSPCLEGLFKYRFAASKGAREVVKGRLTGYEIGGGQDKRALDKLPSRFHLGIR